MGEIRHRRPGAAGGALAALVAALLLIAVSAVSPEPTAAQPSSEHVPVFFGHGAAAALPASQRAELAAMSPRRAARTHVDRVVTEARISSDSRALRVSDVDRPAAPGTAVRFQQRYRGVPVLGGELVARLGPERELLSLAGELVQVERLTTRPRIRARQATGIALDRVARGNRVGRGNLAAGEPVLWVYDPRVLDLPRPRRPLLVWGIDVSSAGDSGPSERVLVDARNGLVRGAMSLVAHAAPDRRICDADSGVIETCEPPYARAEGDPPTGIEDVDELYDNLGLAWQYYFDNFGRDSWGGNGEPIVATARLCNDEECPLANAAWKFDDRTMIVGAGWGVADVIGHELTHGVTQETSGLFYSAMSGAINESMSDIFGELIEPAGERDWLFGEDLPPGQGPMRDLRDPPRLNSPDRVRSPLWQSLGDVHFNSGVGNKAGYLIVEGGSFRGHEIEGIGAEKGGAVYYEAQVGLLTSGSNYRALAFALPQACRNLRGGAEGITGADCLAVRYAVSATQMRRRPRDDQPGNAVACPERGTRIADAFYDDLENPGLRRWRTRTNRRKLGWRYPQPSDQTRATSGVTNFYVNASEGQGLEASIAMRRPIRVPRRGRMHFNHAFTLGVEGDGGFTDGGVVEYRVGKRPWRDARRLFDGHGYNGRLEARRGNPLARHRARRAFTGGTGVYSSSRLDLRKLVGKRVRFRFTLGLGRGQDIQFGDWYIDDVRVYSCVPKG